MERYTFREDPRARGQITQLLYPTARKDGQKQSAKGWMDGFSLKRKGLPDSRKDGNSLYCLLTAGKTANPKIEYA